MYQQISTGHYGPTLRELDSTGVKIFNDWWDTYIPEHKSTLIRKIMHTYYFEEIGAETPDQFIFYINAHLERIMPYYNQLYASELIKIDPLLNHAIESSGRSIQNLLTKANTTDDRFAKAIRDFAGVTDTSGTQNKTENLKADSTKNDTGSANYTKSGTEDIKDKTTAKGTEDETSHETKVVDGTVGKTETEGTTTSDTRNLDRTVTEKPGETSTKTMDWGATESGTEKVTGKDTSKGSGKKDWTETIDDDSSTDTTTKLSEESSGTSTKEYADTPQTALDNQNVRKDYLTNVTWNSESSDHTADTTQHVGFTDDQTKTHTETSSDDNTTDTTKDTTTSKNKGGQDTETTTKSGTNVTDTSETETSSGDKNVNLQSDTTTKDTANTDGTKNVNSTDTTDYTRDKDWTEEGSSKSTNDSTAQSTQDTTSKADSSQTEQTKELSDLSQSSTAMQNKETTETTDKGTTDITKGFMNVSASALLEAFRKTFLNIDSMIIEELRDNFMLVY